MQRKRKCPIWIIIKNKLGLKLTCQERSLLAYWISRKVTKSVIETLEEMESE